MTECNRSEVSVGLYDELNEVLKKHGVEAKVQLLLLGSEGDGLEIKDADIEHFSQSAKIGGIVSPLLCGSCIINGKKVPCCYALK